MRAETVYNVLKALSPEEEKRFFEMCGVVPAKIGKPRVHVIVTDEEATEYLLKRINKKTAP